MEVRMKIAVLWYMKPRGFVEIDPCFTEISVHLYHISRCHMSENINL
jgi:hypothetical protein